jgi:peptidylprolyl isomerase
MKKIMLASAVTLLMLLTGCNAKDSNSTTSSSVSNVSGTTTETVIKRDEKKESEVLVVLKTNQGDITLKMFPKVAPLAVENFVTHAKNGYYNGLLFHRVIKDFMIQGGDPTGTGRGGESIWKKEFINEHASNVVFDRPFLLAMANHGPNTNGSQFFITTKATPFLNGGYTIFGEVVSGQESVRKIENTKTATADRPVSEQKMLKVLVK